jgi:hypothetical protein
VFVFSSAVYTTISDLSRAFQIAALSFLLLFSSCKKSGKDTEEVIPQISVVEIQPLSPAKAKLKATLSGTGFTVQDHGFIYNASENLGGKNDKKVSMGSRSTAGEFSADIDNLYLGSTTSDLILYAKAYVTTTKGIVYGSTAQVVMPRTVIGQFTPAYGKAGDKISLSGKYYTSQSQDLKIFFGGTEAKILSATDQKIEFEVPSGLSQKHGEAAQIYISVDGRKTEATSTFLLYAKIKDFSPKSGPLGTKVTFTGENMPADGGASAFITAIFDGKEIPILTKPNTYIEVPPGSTLQNKIKIRIKDTEDELPGTFTLVPPEFTAFTPKNIFPGATLTLTGKNLPFRLLQTDLQVRIGQYSVTSTTDYTGLWVTVPELPVGTYPVSVIVDPFEVLLPEKLTIRSNPYSFSPTSAIAGTDIKIKGEFNPKIDQFIYFGDYRVGSYLASQTEITVTAPQEATGSIVNLTLQEGLSGKKIRIPGTFTFLKPIIDSFSPISGKPGTRVVVAVRNFSPKGEFTAYMGKQLIDVERIDEYKVSFTIPLHMSPGDYTIRLRVSFQNVETTETFKILE